MKDMANLNLFRVKKIAYMAFRYFKIAVRKTSKMHCIANLNYRYLNLKCYGKKIT
jgi:hypothetical protein